MKYRHRRLYGLAILTGLMTFAAAAPSANASLLFGWGTSCPSQSMVQPFQHWNDSNHYTLVPAGDMESLTGWQLSGATQVVDNESFYVHSTSDRYSLRLLQGSSATSPMECVGIGYPTMRFFAQNLGSANSTLTVSIVFETVLGVKLSLPIGTLTGGASWAPSPALVNTANLLALLPGNMTPVWYQFTISGSGDWRVDDVFVDPYCK